MPELPGTIPHAMEVTPATPAQPAHPAESHPAAPAAETAITQPTKAVRAKSQNPFNDDSSQTSGVQAKGPGVEVRRSEFTEEITNLPAIGKNGKKQEGVSPSETIHIPEDVIDGFRGFAESYVNKLIRLQTLDSSILDGNGQRISLYEQMKREQAVSRVYYPEDELMLELFTENDPDTGELKAKDPSVITELIRSNPKIMESIILVEEKYARDINAAMGRIAELTPGNRTELDYLNLSVDVTDQGAGRSAFNRLTRFLGTSGNEDKRGGHGITRRKGIAITSSPGLTVAAMAAAYSLTRDPSAAPWVIGATAFAAISPSAASFMSGLIKEGVVLRFTADDSERAQSALTTERTRMIEMIGIDPTNPDSSKVLEERHLEALKIIYHRATFMRALGVDANKLDASSDQFLHHENQTSENNKTVVSLNLDANYRRLLNEFTQEQAARALPGTLPPDITLEQQRFVFRRAQEETLTRNLEIAIRKGQASGNDSERLSSRITDLENPTSEAKATRTKDAREEKGRLEIDKTDVSGAQGSIDTYQTTLSELSKSRDSLNSTLAQTKRGTTAYNNPKDAISEITKITSDPTAGNAEIVLEDGTTRTIENIAQRITDARTQRTTAETAAAGLTQFHPKDTTLEKRQRDAMSLAEENFNKKMAEINADRALLDGAKTRLSSLETTIKTTEANLLASSENKAKAKVITDIFSASARLGVPVGADLDTTMAAINTAHATNPAVGWEQKDNAEHRGLVRQAFIGERALAAMRADPAIRGSEGTFNRISARINAETLRTLSIADLEKRADQLGVPTYPARTTELQNAQRWAVAQVNFAKLATEQETQNINSAITTQEKAINNVDVPAELAQLKFIKSIDDDTEGIRDRAFNAFSDTGRQKLENDNPFHPLPGAGEAEGYTQAEVDSGIPRNVLEIINILTDYQNGSDRAGSFNKTIQGLGSNPQERIARFLFSSFENLPPLPAGPIAPPAGSLQEFGIRLRLGIQAGTVRRRDIGVDMEKTIDQFLIWSKTL